jgi:O-antigen ligase
MKLFLEEAGAFACLLLLALRVGSGASAKFRQVAVFCAGTIAAVLAVMLLVGLIHSAGLPGSGRLAGWGWIRVEATDPKAPWHLQFPFEHHNRAGYFAMCAAFILPAAASAFRIRVPAGIAGSATATAAMFLTMTRGALGSAVAGAAFWAAGANIRRKPVWLAAAAVCVIVGFVLLPATHRAHIQRALDPATYRPSNDSSIGSRILLWQATGGMILRRPVFGFGYGYENFEGTARAEYPDLLKKLEGMSHAHNQWLEIAAESGIPAALAFLAFTLARMGALAGAWHRARRRSDPMEQVLLLWLALEIAVQAYGMGNYGLRRNIGFFTYGIWAVSLLLTAKPPLPKTVPDSGH